MSIWDPKQSLENLGVDVDGKQEEKKRSCRVAQAVLRELSLLLVEKIADPRLQPVTLSRVDVTDDLGLAKIYYTVLGGERKRQDAAKGFKKAAGFCRSHIAKTINLRFTPVLQFHYDNTAEKVAELEEIFQEIARERENHGTDSAAGS